MHLKKSLGQHLLVATPIIQKIIKLLGASNDDCIVEIGPGTGYLTKLLSKEVHRVVAVEKDFDMIPRLEDLGLKNVEIVRGDFLKIDLGKIGLLGHPKNLFCGNIPYNISTPIMFKLRDNRVLFSRGILTMQREVANRLIARPASKEYGVLSVMMQVCAKIKKCFDIAKGSFLPPPKITSSAVLIEFYDKSPYSINDMVTFEGIVKSSFMMRRKMIRNSLCDHMVAIEAAGIDPTRRPETLSIEEFVKIANLSLPLLPAPSSVEG